MTIKQLSTEDKHHAFKRATNSFKGAAERWVERAQTGMTDEELADALAFEMGISGGMGSKNELSIAYQGSGLKIWAAWSIEDRDMDNPIFEGKATIAMAREVYGIYDPSDNQLAMF